MNNTNRRNFLKSSATVGAGIMTTQFNSTWAGIKGANTDVRAAVGCGEKVQHMPVI